MRQDRSVKKKENKPQKNALILGGTPHVVVGVIGELEDMGRERNLLLRGIAILCGIFEENGVCIAGDVFVRVQSNQGRRIQRGVDVVSEKTLSEAGDYGVVRDVGKGGKVRDVLELLMVGGRLPVHRHSGDCRLLAG